MMTLRIENLVLSQGGRRVLTGATAAFAPGKVTAILGAAGSGKAALLQAIAGRLDADAGQVRIDGRLIGRLSGAERKRAVALVKAARARRGFFVRAPLDLETAFAAAPQWLLAEDGLSGLDPAAQCAAIARLRAAAGEGMGVLVALADPVVAARLADDVLLLGEGGMVGFGPAAELLSHQNLRAAFGIEVMVIGDAGGRLLPVPIGPARG